MLSFSETEAFCGVNWMVFLNYSTMQMVAKIVYYGPGLCGKTTNLKTIYKNTDDRSRGEMVSLATETDRTLFFDLLPMEVGVIGGFKTKFQLYTVPGQVFYNTTRKLVLRGVDGIVFVADSQSPMMDANKESFQNLRENLGELNLDVHDIPFVFQYNKRDLPNVIPVDILEKELNVDNLPYVESSALNGVGVFETLREISKQTLLVLNSKSQGNQLESQKPAAMSGKMKRVVPEASIPEVPETNSGTMPLDVDFDEELGGKEPPIIDDSDAFSPELVDPDQDDGVLKDSFEKTLENLELDFDDDDDFDSNSLDMEEFDNWEEDSFEDDSLEDVSAVAMEEPEPLEEEATILELDAATDEPGDLSLDAEPVQAEEAFEMEPEPLASEEAFGLESIGDENPVFELDAEMEVEQTPAPEAEEATLVADDPNLHKPQPGVVRESIPAQPEEVAKATDFLQEMNEPKQKTRSAPEKAASAQRKKTSDALADLRSMTTRVPTRAAPKKKKGNMDSLLNGLVGQKTVVPTEKKRLKVKAPFETAQLNCVFVDGDGNVVDNRLVKVTPIATAAGKYRLKVIIDIEVEP